MYQSHGDIKELSLLMVNILEGKVSRNKNFYTLAKAKEYHRFKRAKLLLSLVEDLEQAIDVPGYEIGTHYQPDCVEIFLYNPSLKYNRRVMVSQEELELLRQKTQIKLN